MSLTNKDYININLLRVALGIQGGDNVMPSDKEWRDFFLFCKDQAMLGIGFSAVEKIRDCPKDFMLKRYVLQKKYSLSIYKHYPSELCWGLYHSIYYGIACHE